MIKVTVGGVPEHFNLAWHLAIENGTFAKHGIEIIWQDVPGGTGAMCKALREGELDIAIALTEGMISDIVQGNPSKIVQFYVNSPLRWGIFTSVRSSIKEIAEMEGKKYAISRYKSGSHLMAYVHANRYGWSLHEDDFEVVGNLDGARQALAKGTSDLFMWEKFTTKPLVDSGEFKMIGECNTPWPCFVVAATDNFINQHEDVLKTILNIINLSCLMLKNNSEAPALIAYRYGIKLDDAMAWFKELEYAYHPEMDEDEVLAIFDKLKQFGILSFIPEPATVCFYKHLETV